MLYFLHKLPISNNLSGVRAAKQLVVDKTHKIFFSPSN